MSGSVRRLRSLSRGRKAAVIGLASALAAGGLTLSVALGTFASTTPLLSMSSTAAGVKCSTGLLVSPWCTGIAPAETISLSGTGFVPGALASIEECSDDPSQPIIFFLGTSVPVSCTAISVTTVPSNGNLAGSKVVKGGTLASPGTTGPPQSGFTPSCIASQQTGSTTTTSSIPNCTTTGNAATDAARFPCPPTSAQIAAGDACIFAIGDNSGDHAVGTILWTGESVLSKTSSTASPSSLTLDSGTITDTATVTGETYPASPLGTAKFYACQTGVSSSTLAPGPCAASGTPEDTETLTANADNVTSSATSVPFTPSSVGTWCFSVVFTDAQSPPLYGSSADNTTVANADQNECVLVGPQATTTTTTTTTTTSTTTTTTTSTTTTTTTPTSTTSTTTLPIPNGPIGTFLNASTLALGPTASVSDAAVVVGNATSGSPTGNVDFYACQTGTSPTLTPAPCTPAPSSHLSTTRVSAAQSNTSDAFSLPLTPTAAGTWCFSAVYDGDSNYAPAYDNTTAATVDPSECLLVSNAASTSASTVSTVGVTLGPSGTVQDDVTVSGNLVGGTPTGTVAFYACQTGTLVNATLGPCPANGTPVDTETLVGGQGDTASALSTSFVPTAAGIWCFSTVYGGDANYTASSDNTSAANVDSNECLGVAQASTSTGTTVSSANVTLGPAGTVTDNVTVNGNSVGGSPTGNVTFYACQIASSQTLTTGPCAASGTPQSTQGLAAAAGNTATATSATFTANMAGTWCFSAAYNGDSNYTTSSDNTTAGNADPAECVLVAQAGTTTGTQVSSAVITLGPSGTVTDAVTVSGNAAGGSPTGSVSFYACQTGNTGSLTTGPCTASGTPESTVGLAAAAGNAATATSTTFTPGSPGTWCFSAVYGGDNNYTSSSDNTTNANLDANECVFVNAVAPQVTAQPTNQTVANGTQATFTATASGNPVPTVQWQSSTNGGVSFTNIGGATSASYSVTATLAGVGTEYRAVFTNFGGSATSSAALLGVLGGNVTSSKTTAIIGNQTDAVAGTGWYPLNGDTTVVIYECATNVYVAAACDQSSAMPQVVKTTGLSIGNVPSTNLNMVVGTIDANGDTCGLAGSPQCYVLVRGSSGDSNFVAINFSVPTATLKSATDVPGNYDNKLTTHFFPLGDSVTASECDSTATVANLSTHCDTTTAQTGTSGTGGVIGFPDGPHMLVDAAYSDTAGGVCVTGGTCSVEVTDSTTPTIVFLLPASMATPTLTITPASAASGTKVSLSAAGFPIGDPVTGEECDTAATAAKIATNCDSATAITGTVSATGTITWSVTSKVTVLSTTTAPAYADSSSPPAGCAAGDTVGNHDPCYIALFDTSNAPVVVLTPLSITS